MPTHINIHEAKTHLSNLLARVSEGEEIVIDRAGKPIAKLIPIERRRARRPLGGAKGKIWVADDFDAPLPDEVLKLFEE